MNKIISSPASSAVEVPQGKASEWLITGKVRSLGHVWESLTDALLDRDPFVSALPCWAERKELSDCADRILRRALLLSCVEETAYFEIIAISDAIECVDRRSPIAPFYEDVSIAEAIQYQSFAGLHFCSCDTTNIHVQKRALLILQALKAQQINHISGDREHLLLSCPRGHQWASMRFVDSFHPQEPNCPVCQLTWCNVVDDLPSSK